MKCAEFNKSPAPSNLRDLKTNSMGRDVRFVDFSTLVTTPLLAALSALVFISAQAWAARNLPYSVTWQKFISAQNLTSEDQQLAKYIVEDSLWYDNEHQFERRAYPRPVLGPRTGAQELEHILDLAAQGDQRALNIVVALLKSSSFRRPLKGLVRGSIPTGTLILRPDDESGNIYGIARQAIAHALKNKSGPLDKLFQELTKIALKNPNQSDLVESIAALAAIPQFSSAQSLRDFFLLMSIHPEPRIRISGLFGLGGHVDDPFVREFLIQSSRLRPRSLFGEEEKILVQKVLSQVGSKYPVWQSIFTEIYKRWEDDPFPNRVRDIGDYNWERMANSAAAQALLRSLPMLERRLSIRTAKDTIITAFENLEEYHSLPVLNGLLSGNGTGFQILRSLRIGSQYNVSIVYPASIKFEASPTESWLIKGMSAGDQDHFFSRMMHESTEVFFGHLESVVSLLKFRLLKLNPPPSYYHHLGRFQNFLRAKLEAQKVHLKNKNMRLVSAADPFAQPTNVVDLPKEEEFFSGQESIFVAPLYTLFAARALALVGEKQTATEVLVTLLPNIGTSPRRSKFDWPPT